MNFINIFKYKLLKTMAPIVFNYEYCNILKIVNRQKKLKQILAIVSILFCLENHLIVLAPGHFVFFIFFCRARFCIKILEIYKEIY